MTPETQQTMDEVAREWLATVEIIAKTLFEITGRPWESCLSIARAIIARLAAHEPPIYLTMDEEIVPLTDIEVES